jgi:hypothetical protein
MHTWGLRLEGLVTFHLNIPVIKYLSKGTRRLRTLHVFSWGEQPSSEWPNMGCPSYLSLVLTIQTISPCGTSPQYTKKLHVLVIKSTCIKRVVMFFLLWWTVPHNGACMINQPMNRLSPAVICIQNFAQCSNHHLFALWWKEIGLLSYFGSHVCSEPYTPLKPSRTRTDGCIRKPLSVVILLFCNFAFNDQLI